VKTALVVGCKGQDGTYLTSHLQAKGYCVTGIDRWVAGSLRDASGYDIQDKDAVMALVRDLAPDEIYYLAAFHQSSEAVSSDDHTLIHQSSEAVSSDDHTLVQRSLEINTLSLNNFLYAIAARSPRSKLFYASSSRVFGEPLTDVQDETTPLNPMDPYGISKTAGMHLCRYYRRRHQIYASVGILYNHESPRRAPSYITRKVVQAAVRIRKQTQAKLMVGDLEAMVDWGYAPDYIDAMWRILQLPEPDDFVVATGTLNSVRDLVSITFDAVGLNWAEHVELDPRFARAKGSNSLRGNSAKLRSRTGWHPTASLRDIIREMILAEEEHGL
jgi:GDPmannose 4,6-dehydratase